MKNWLIILLVAAVVAAGAFLPELLLKWSRPPELDMEVQQVAVTSQSSSDYTWRMGTLAESFYGEGEQLLPPTFPRPTRRRARGRNTPSSWRNLTG